MCKDLLTRGTPWCDKKRFGGYNSDDSQVWYQPQIESEVKKYEDIRREIQARKDQQTKKQQLKTQEIQIVAEYWADAINNANTVATILKVQDWMSSMAETIQKTQALQSGAGSSKPTPNFEIKTSNEDGTTIEVSSGPTLVWMILI